MTTADTPMAVPAGQRLAGFAALLREHGLRVGVAEQQAMLQAAMALGALRGAALCAAWRAIACHSPREWRQWPELFDRYWFPHRLQGQVRVSGQTRASRSLRQAVQAMHDDMASAAPGAPGRPPAPADMSMTATAGDDTPGSPRAMGGASRTAPRPDALHQREGQMWLPQDLTELQRLARRISARLRPRATRCWRNASRGSRLHVRQTLRRSTAFGGEPVQPAWQLQRHEPPRLFLLVDVSHSMESHAPLFLRVARAFALVAGARVFVFHTRLAEITPLMQHDSARVQEKVNAVTAGFGAGTRIAASLHDFLRAHARAQLNRSSRVWIFSDGFDTDAPDELAQALQALRMRGARVTWFHPTRTPPASASVRQARSCIERFVPLASLADLAAASRSLQ